MLPYYLFGHTLELFTQQGLAPADVCFELSVHCGGEKDRHLFEISDRYHFQGFRTMLTNRASARLDNKPENQEKPSFQEHHPDLK